MWADLIIREYNSQKELYAMIQTIYQIKCVYLGSICIWLVVSSGTHDLTINS